MQKPTPITTDPVAIIKAAQAAAETECNNLAQQLARSEQFAIEVRTKLVHAQGKYAAHTEMLKMLEPPAEPPQKADPV